MYVDARFTTRAMPTLHSGSIFSFEPFQSRNVYCWRPFFLLYSYSAVCIILVFLQQAISPETEVLASAEPCLQGRSDYRQLLAGIL
ncbi:hypothetical protein IF1G_03332 [Cordyceps javanica]|uniref:Uncharacterized protein n=1 Tax=Cordyceps javanica TaxID=43265 RepID=A0A545V798_9HYPO|nr:hypothetical protein IF1G_03332 [Cordyceps javanica]